MSARRWLGLILCGIALLLLAAWVGRAWLAGEIARAYFRAHGIPSQVEIGSLGLTGITGRFALGPPGAPDVSARRIEVHFDPVRWMPYIVEVRLVDPVVRARIGDDGRIALGSLQHWLDSLPQGGKSDYVSENLAIAMTGLSVHLATPAGALEIDGDVKLVKNLPVSAALAARPANIRYRGNAIKLNAAHLNYDAASGRVSLHIAADVNNPAARARGLVADVQADGLHWQAQDGAIAVTAPRAHLKASAEALDAATRLDHPVLDLTLSRIQVRTGGGLRAAADVAASLGAGLALAAPNTGDPRLTAAITRNLKHLDATFQAHVTHDRGRTEAVLTAPLKVSGAAGAHLDVATFALKGSPDALTARFDAVLAGGGLPRITATSPNLAWTGGGLAVPLKMAAAFDYAMLRGARLAGQGTLSWQGGAYAFQLHSCAPLHLAQFRPAKVMAAAISASLCPTAGKPLLGGSGGNWRLIAAARNIAADLPLAGVHLDQGAARLDFHAGSSPNPLEGSVAISAARIRDGASPIRFNPVSGSGTLRLAGGIWRGTLAVSGKDGAALGDVAVTHVMASGRGSAHIAAPRLTFDPAHLQPVDLSPLLAAFRQTKGVAHFDGDVAWNTAGLDSHGTLAIDGLDFLTPLGTAHAVKTKLAFTSLLPPRTAPGQDLTISRIDWTLPFTGLDLKFGFDSSAITVNSLKAGFADGHASLGSFTVKTADPTRIQGAADLDAITLSSVIAATNLGSKVRLEGKVSGHIPFTTGPEGVRIANGHIASDGPGRLSIDRNLWTQGGGASANAVQDFAYQALENLAFDQMSAQLNSVPGGRLQVIFHIKGHSDPPKPQIAEVPLGDILSGSALQQSIPLPSGTPIDLTLDTSLNFDELLKSYAEAWSKALGPARRTP